MATAPAKTDKPKRKQGPRVVKDKVYYLVYKGQLEGDVEVVENTGPEFVDRMLADRDLKYTKVTIKPKRRAKAESAAHPSLDPQAGAAA